MKKIAIGCDPNAAGLKEAIIKHLAELGYECEDYGSDDPIYANVAIDVAEAVASGKNDRGILMCGTGIGMSMVANKYPHVRAALCNDLFSAGMSRRHNDANILVMGGRVIGDILALEIVKAWLETPFDGGRHQNRLDMFDTV